MFAVLEPAISRYVLNIVEGSVKAIFFCPQAEFAKPWIVNDDPSAGK